MECPALIQVLKCHHSVRMLVKTWNQYVEEEHFMHLVRSRSSSTLFVRLFCDLHYNEGVLSPIHVARLLCVCHSSFTVINVYYLLQSVSDWFLVFSFLATDLFQCAEECTCIIILLSIYLPMQTPIYRPIFLFPYLFNKLISAMVHNFFYCNFTLYLRQLGKQRW